MTLDAEYCYAECHLSCLAQISLFVLSVIMLNVILLSAVVTFS